MPAICIRPTAAIGMNLGIADGVDLGWKLAAVLRRLGRRSRCSTSYEQERRAVHQRTIEAGDRELPHAQRPSAAGGSRRRHAGRRARARRRRGRDPCGQDTRVQDARRRARIALRELTDHRRATARPPPAEPSTRSFEPSAHPGCLAPHAWLADGSSLYDHFGLGFSLLVLADCRPVRRPRHRRAAEAARRAA